MTDRQLIKAGGESVNVQAAGDVHMGMQYGDIRQALMDLFEQNYDRLLAVAADEAQRRVGELNDAFVKRIADLPQEVIKNLAEPDVQRSLLQAQIEHATNGDPEDVDLYANLLVEKLGTPAKNMTSIACRQAIETVGQLTASHVDLLTCLFVVHRVSYQGVVDAFQLQRHYAAMLDPFGASISDDHDTLRYLDSTACLGES